jgi:two-component system response regulator HydG
MVDALEVWVKEATLIVVRLSDAFTEVWTELAGELGVDLRVPGSNDAWVPGSDVAAVIVAAGGAEREALEWFESQAPETDVPNIAVGIDANHRMAAQLVGAGASDYFALPQDAEVLRNVVKGAVESRRAALRREARRTSEDKSSTFASIIGESSALKAALTPATKVLPHGDATILIVGETGTGKELLARAVHKGGPRGGAPFVAVNCTALPAQLLESELFGHERGAFTDAKAAKPGLFEVADGGTLLLDEVGDLAPELQAKLLRVLEDKQLRRVGGTTWRKADVRIIAATHQDLARAVQLGTFRQDLFFRLSVIKLTLPPLRERGGDAVLIAETLLERLAAQYGLPVPHIDEEVRRTLLTYHWPGNVRELKNSVERALLLSPPGELCVKELLHQASSAPGGSGPIPFPAALHEITTAAAHATLDLCQGNRSEASRRLGISRARLARLLNNHQLTE